MNGGYRLHGRKTFSTNAPVADVALAFAYLGRAVSGAGDVDGDGYSEIVVGAYVYSNGEIAGANFSGDCHLHNQTMTVTWIVEI